MGEAKRRADRIAAILEEADRRGMKVSIAHRNEPPEVTEGRTKMDQPIERDGKGGWQLNLLEGRQVEWGYIFSEEHGYRVYLQYADSVATNTMSPDSAVRMGIRVAETPAEDEAERIARQHFGSNLVAQGKLAGHYQALWESFGKPPGGLKAIPAQGRA